jgi:RNA polymerase sigma factor (sigma-70 family)
MGWNDMEENDQLLKAYAERGDEAAFRELVERYTRLVYSTALRQVNDAHAAEDITQLVFTHFAQEAGKLLRRRAVIGGWLYRDTVFTASKYRRSTQRRLRREEEASRMNEQNVACREGVWDEVAPVIDEALRHLGGRDRNAIVLRFFDGRALRSVGEALGISEDAARMRVDRALERLRKFLVNRGVAVSAGTLVTLLGTHAASAAPESPAESIAFNALENACAKDDVHWHSSEWLASKGLYFVLPGAVLLCLLTAFVWRSMVSAKSTVTLLLRPNVEVASIEIQGGVRRTTSNPTAMSVFVFKSLVLRPGEQVTVTNTRGQYRVTLRPVVEANRVRVEAFLLEDASNSGPVLFPDVVATNGEQVIASKGIYSLELRPALIPRK